MWSFLFQNTGFDKGFFFLCSYETICQTLRDYAVLQANNPKSDTGMAKKVAEAVDAHQDELKEIISEVTVNIHGSFVSKSSPDHPEFDALRLFCCLKNNNQFGFASLCFFFCFL